MTRLIHDQYAKECLSEILEPVGGNIQTHFEIRSEVYYADLSFETPPKPPQNAFDKLGLLGRMVSQDCLIFEVQVFVHKNLNLEYIFGNPPVRWMFGLAY
jgi:hypothetical protein